MTEIRILGPSDESTLEAFLLPRVESSMFFIGNMRAAGLADGGETYQGTYAAALEEGRIIGVVAHYWNGVLILQAPVHLESLWRAAVSDSGRRVRGLIGPEEQVNAVFDTLGLSLDQIQLDEREDLYRLDLDALKVPRDLRLGRLRGRRIQSADLDLLTDWRVVFAVEVLNEVESPKLHQSVRSGLERSLLEGRTWVLEDKGRPVAVSSFNTAIREAVQVGGVFTPPELRCSGYGRSVVAASLLDARAEGASTGILFTGKGNIAAQRAYLALGFRYVRDWRLILLRNG
jgi:RimJ/RimL family protein N-acetyltransferase